MVDRSYTYCSQVVDDFARTRRDFRVGVGVKQPRLGGDVSVNSDGESATVLLSSTVTVNFKLNIH